jgi:hypothetical protein
LAGINHDRIYFQTCTKDVVINIPMGAAQTENESVQKLERCGHQQGSKEVFYPTGSLNLFIRIEFEYCTTLGVAEHTAGHFNDLNPDLLVMDD